MDSHLTISYRHNRVTGEPLFAGNQIAQCVAHDVRQQLTRGDDRVLAIDLERWTRVRAMRVNHIPYELEWSTDAPVSDDRGKPVLGVCEFDPDGLPDTALICVNPDPVEGRTELLLSTGAHEMGHGIFEAPAWICAHQRRSMPTLFDVADPAAPRRVWRTTTPNEGHFSATYPPGSNEFFQETRANEFMGSLLATYGMAKGWVEFWLIWVAVDVVGVPLLVSAGYYASAFMYVFYGAFTLVGFFVWWRVNRRATAEAAAAGAPASA